MFVRPAAMRTTAPGKPVVPDEGRPYPAASHPRGPDHTMNEEIDPRVWRRIYVATLAYGVVTIAVLWWFTAVFD